MALPYFVEGEFVLQTDMIDPERHDNIDLYIPKSGGPFPAVIFQCGGPLPEDADWNDPRDWQVYRSYGSLLAANGIVAATVKLPLYEGAHYPRAAKGLAQAVDFVRADERVDGDRVGLWFWCAGGPLSSNWLRSSPPWLRVLAFTYPLLGSPEGVSLPDGFEPAEALAEAEHLPPLLLGRAGLEAPGVARTVETFVAAAEKHQAPLQIIDVATGFHGYDIVNHADKKIGNPPPDAVRPDFATSLEESRAAVHKAVDFVAKALA
ncbi:alpha/beta hydrolase family protein [Micromonospora deserti]|uniref:alpha/beta hydrolase family protein n=1 Tax=Micromonospora deserti TaxID=2070366 RepID=UPI001F34B19B|nr:alpha/beta hydrolase [Micromonospora deserti]